MRLLKKMISAFLVICMVISMVPMAALATETDSVPSAEGRIMMDSSIGQASVWIDGIEYAVQNSGGSKYVDLPAGTEPGSMVTYSYHVGDADDVHTQYPVGMQVWALNKNADGSYTPEAVEELNNILQYSGSSIRITGNKGIRMITSIEKNKKNDLVSGGLGGYKLLEYGTVLAWSSNLAGGNPLVLGPDYAKSNYAYKKGVADPIFAYSGNLMQYTNVLVGFTLDQCKDDISMRPYMILEKEDGQQITIYGGIVQRSIGYIAWQNKDVFAPGTAAYNYVWEIINHVYAQVTFETNGGNAIENAFVRKGDSLVRTATPVRTGYTFGGWYTDAALTQPLNASEFAIREDITLYAKWTNSTNVNLSDFTADETCFLAKRPYTVIFSVDASEASDDIDIYCDDDYVGDMHDDGLNGDAVADDGVYSFTLEGIVEQAGSFVYYACTEASTSNQVTLYYFERPTEANTPAIRNEAESIQNNIESIEERYYNEAGVLPIDQVTAVIEEISSYVEELYNAGQIIWFEVNDSNVIVRLESGFTFTYMLNIQGSDSIGDNVSMSITTCQPCLSMYGNYTEDYIPYPQGITQGMTMPDVAASTVASTFNNYTFSRNYDNSAVSLARVRNFSSNQVILWHGHGGYSSSRHSFLITGEEFDWTAWWWDEDYFLDNVQGRIFEASNGNTCITSKYIDKYCGRMTNSLVYLAACQSGKDSVLANAFLNKGATAVIANSETIFTLYNLIMEYVTIRNMCNINPSTSNYYTLSEALAAAKAEYGYSDRIYNGKGATPLIFGGSPANNYRFADNARGTLAGKVLKASDRTTPVTTATVNIMKDGETISFQPGSDGGYSRELSVGTHYVKVVADGYIEFNAYADIEKDQTVYMETFLMVEGEEGQVGEACGTITNALTGAGIEGVTLDVRKGWNNNSVGEVLTTITTNASGKYMVSLPIGNYTLCASKNGFISTMVNIVVQPNMSTNKDSSMTPVLSENDYRIILVDWAENPRDLDAHVVGTLSNGNSFHVYYANKTAYDDGVAICNLDIDHQYSEGAETITLTTNTTQPYYYYIHHYAGSSNIPSSGAQIKVVRGEEEIKTFNVPTDRGTGLYWNVFAIVNGELIIRDTMTDVPETSYASAATFRFRAPTLNAHPVYDDYPPKETVPEEAIEPMETVAKVETRKIYLSLDQFSQDYTWKVVTQDAEYDVAEEADGIYVVELPGDIESIFLQGEFEDTQISSVEIDLTELQDNNCIMALACEENTAEFDIQWGIFDPETEEVTFAVVEALAVEEETPAETVAEETASTEETENVDSVVTDDADAVS